MRLLITIFLLCIFSTSYSDEGLYKTYINEKYGVSFQYPASTSIEDSSLDGKITIWFKYKNSPVTGILFNVAETEKFKTSIKIERKKQEKYKNEMTEKEYKISGSVKGIEFIRDIKLANRKIHYYLFPSLKENVTLSLWHPQDTSTGFMGNPEKEEKVLSDYRYMIKTLKLIK